MADVRIGLSLMGAALVVAAGGAFGAPAQPSIKQQMKSIVDGASTAVFGIAGDADPANGPPPPVIAAPRWEAAADAAGKLKGVGLSLQDPARAKDQGDWMTFAKQFTDLSDAAAKAAAAHDGAALAKAANDLSDNCSACHAKYKPQG